MSERELTQDAADLVVVRDLIDQAIRVLRHIPDGDGPAVDLDCARSKVVALHGRIQDQVGRWHPELGARR